MSSRPYVLLSVAASLDGYIDDTSDTRLLLSNDADFDRVDEVRADVDAILVGANTIRADNPRLLVRSAERQRQRIDAGKSSSPIKVTLTSSGHIDPDAKFFTTGDNEKIVYTTSDTAQSTAAKLESAATVVEAWSPLDLSVVLADLADRKVGRLMIEGGGAVHTAFLTAGLVDELQLVFAPFFVGEVSAPRFVGPGAFPQDPAHPMTLTESRQIGDCMLLRYLPEGSHS